MHRPHLNLCIPFFRIVGVERSVCVCACGRVRAIFYTGNVLCLICVEDLVKRVIMMTLINMCHGHPFV